MAAPSASDMVIVVAGGDPVEPSHVAVVPEGTPVIAADSGIDHAHALGLVVDVAVGDFDSVTDEGLARAVAEGATVERHPVTKDATDLELALDAAVALGPARVHVLGGHGGRLDHLLANGLLLASARYAAVEVTAQMGAARVSVVRSQAELTGPIGDLVSLLAVHGAATGITTDGLLYPLIGEDLRPGSSRGVSNELSRPAATITVAAGVLLAVQPGQLGSHAEPSP